MRLDLERIALEYVVPCLHDIGFCYLDNFLGEVVGDCVLERVKRMHRDGELADGQLAGPSRGVAKRHLRGDQIKWIGGTEEGCEAINFLLTLIDRLVMYCGSRLGKYYVKERSKVRVRGAPTSCPPAGTGIGSQAARPASQLPVGPAGNFARALARVAFALSAGACGSGSPAGLSRSTVPGGGGAVRCLRDSRDSSRSPALAAGGRVRGSR